MADADPPDRARSARTTAFAPGRVNLIGEHTDYNGGLALPFAIDRGVTVTVTGRAGDPAAPSHTTTAAGAEPFLAGAVAELAAAGIDVPPAEVAVMSDLPIGAGLSSSAALSAALVLALVALAGVAEPPRPELVRLCARIENDRVGARTGLLDQTAVLMAPPTGGALLIDFAATSAEPVALELGGWRLAVLDSGARHDHATTGYNDRRAECERARAALGLSSLSAATKAAAATLTPPLDRRVRHVLSENARVRDTVAALAAGEPAAVAALLNASHHSLRDDFEVSVPAVERTRDAALAAGASGARIVGGGFGGSVLALFGPGRALPAGATVVEPSGPAAVRR